MYGHTFYRHFLCEYGCLDRIESTLKKNSIRIQIWLSRGKKRVRVPDSLDALIGFLILEP